MEATKGNKLIAEFMGAVVEKPYNDYDDVSGLMFYFHGVSSPAVLNKRFSASEIKYHSSWDWLMPVYKKCYDLWLESHKDNKDIAAWFENVWGDLWKADIEGVYDNIIHLIEVFNQSKTEGE